MGRPKTFDPDTAVERAMRVFWTKGYAATSPQDLLDELQIGKGSLYHSFGSKRELFDRALDRYRQLQSDTLADLLEQPGPVRQRLRAGLSALVDFNFSGEYPRGCFAVNTAAELGGADQDATEQVRRSFDRTESALRAVLDEGIRCGELDPTLDAEATASMLLAVTIGIQVTARTATTATRQRRIVAAALALL